jgi:hypothetical protein
MSGPYGLLTLGPDGKDKYGPESLTYKQALAKLPDNPEVIGVYMRQATGNKVVFRRGEKS